MKNSRDTIISRVFPISKMLQTREIESNHKRKVHHPSSTNHSAAGGSPCPCSCSCSTGGTAPPSVVLTNVGAILLFFEAGPFSSLSLSLFFFDDFSLAAAAGAAGSPSFSDSLSRRPLPGGGLIPLTELAAL